MATHTPSTEPNPALIMETLGAYQQTMALQGAIKLDLFTHIGGGATTPSQIAPLIQASERGVRILCDYLTVIGFLTKTDGKYGLTQDSALFLNKNSPAYMGTLADFLTHDLMMGNFRDIAAIVRKGGAVFHSTLSPDDPVWVEFARSMAPMMGLPAEMIAQLAARPGEPIKVLDIAAGHGLFGLAIARHNAAAQVYASDWANVLEVARENAAKFGVADRYHTIPGSSFDADLGSGYDLILLPNFLHHFDVPTNVTLLKKLHAAMKPGATLATLEFVPNEDRVSPPMPATFSMMMLGSTEHGDAYTFRELDGMLRQAGFGESRIQSIAPSPETLILTKRS